ncbi:MAG: hypothetical protein JO099_04070 [Acidobacteriia bacterium]|nr:hypothetical protein [Terriglobia bacterium]
MLRLLFVLVLILLSVEMNPVTRQTTADQQPGQDYGPTDGLAIPGALSADGRGSRLYCREGRTGAQNQLQVPRHQIQVGLPTYLAP